VTAPGSIAFVSRAPQADIERWNARMGWEIPWYTITDDCDVDFGVRELQSVKERTRSVAR
jgi:predicted dithiol-disulfide oxidoreductase (DUF899 family)